MLTRVRKVGVALVLAELRQHLAQADAELPLEVLWGAGGKGSGYSSSINFLSIKEAIRIQTTR